MADETVRQESTEQTEEKYFTQAELDAIIETRLGRERAKYADYDALKEKAQKYDEAEDANKSELQKAQEQAQALRTQLEAMQKADAVRAIREKVSAETGVPTKFLKAETEEECRAEADDLLKWRPNTYPDVRDGGEPIQPPLKRTTRELFAEALKNGGI